jgi:hypothetical protein
MDEKTINNADESAGNSAEKSGNNMTELTKIEPPDTIEPDNQTAEKHDEDAPETASQTSETPLTPETQSHTSASIQPQVADKKKSNYQDNRNRTNSGENTKYFSKRERPKGDTLYSDARSLQLRFNQVERTDSP